MWKLLQKYPKNLTFLDICVIMRMWGVMPTKGGSLLWILNLLKRKLPTTPVRLSKIMLMMPTNTMVEIK